MKKKYLIPTIDVQGITFQSCIMQSQVPTPTPTTPGNGVGAPGRLYR